MTLYQSVSMERCDPVKKIAVDMPGKLYSNGIELALGREGKLCSFTLNHAAPARQIEECRIRQADVLLLGVSVTAGYTAVERRPLLELVRRELPESKIVLVVDDSMSETLNDQVKDLKQKGLADTFVYTTAASFPSETCAMPP